MVAIGINSLINCRRSKKIIDNQRSVKGKRRFGGFSASTTLPCWRCVDGVGGFYGMTAFMDRLPGISPLPSSPMLLASH